MIEKKQEPLATLSKLEFLCPEAGLVSRSLEDWDVYFYADIHEYGSHGGYGSIRVEFDCPCGRVHTVELRRW